MRKLIWWYLMFSGEWRIVFQMGLTWVLTKQQIQRQSSCWMLKKDNQNPSLRTALLFLAFPIRALGNNKVLYCLKSLLPGGIADNYVIFCPGHKRGKILGERHWAVQKNPNCWETLEVHLISKQRLAVDLWPIQNLTNHLKTLWKLLNLTLSSEK